MEYSGTWLEIWTQKGEMEGSVEDIRVYDGWEHSNADIRKTAERITAELDIRHEDKVLEVGCGAGALAQYMDCQYIGIDFSPTLVKKHIEFFQNSVLVAPANDLPFKDGYFDKVFCWGVFLYFDSKEYARQAIEEMKRVCKGGIFIGELPMRSHRQNHQLFTKDDFDAWKGWKISRGWSPPYEDDRFNVTYIP